jgi:ribosomal protein L28
MRATRRTFKPNLVYKWVVMEDGRKVRVRIDSKLYKKMR